MIADWIAASLDNPISFPALFLPVLMLMVWRRAPGAAVALFSGQAFFGALLFLGISSFLQSTHASAQAVQVVPPIRGKIYAGSSMSGGGTQASWCVTGSTVEETAQNYISAHNSKVRMLGLFEEPGRLGVVLLDAQPMFG